MIKILRDPRAGARGSKGEVDILKLQASTANHIDHVSQGLGYFAELLKKAGERHDHTKTDNMAAFHEALQSKNIKNTRWYKMHITKERHHLISNPPEDINLIDVLEHLVDCVMAGSVRSGKIFDLDLPDELLQKAHKNTVEMLKKHLQIVDVEE